jgi:hypothetical protein
VAVRFQEIRESMGDLVAPWSIPKAVVGWKTAGQSFMVQLLGPTHKIVHKSFTKLFPQTVQHSIELQL